MKKLYNYPEINFIAFQEGDILAEVSVGPGGAVNTGEPEIGWGDWYNSQGGSAASDVGEVLDANK